MLKTDEESELNKFYSVINDYNEHIIEEKLNDYEFCVNNFSNFSTKDNILQKSPNKIRFNKIKYENDVNIKIKKESTTFKKDNIVVNNYKDKLKSKMKNNLILTDFLLNN